MNDFICPACKGFLRVGDHLILKMKNSKKQSSILLLSPQIGNYTTIKHPSFETKAGEYIEFYCPLCNSSLNSDIHQNLAHLTLIEENGKRADVYFSQITGEHSTFKINGETVCQEGEDAGLYTYFKIGDKFKKYF